MSTQLVNAELVVREYDEKERLYYDRMVPMLYTDRVMALALSTALSPGMLPFLIHKDISSIEMYLRRVNPNDYNREFKKTCWIDYVFS